MESGTLYLMALVLFFVCTMIYNNYLCIEVRLTKYLERELAKEYEITPKTPWKIVGLEIESITRSCRIDSKTYHCEFGLIKGYKNGYADIVGCRASVIKYKSNYSMLGIYERE
jgi:hypothetical protein